jgi:hypothetical protein
MAKKIYPGNWVNALSSYQGQPVVAIPGRVYYHITGYALITGTGATSWDITIPSPDKRGDDKPRADITSLVVPSGAKVYGLALRVPDMRKDRGVGTAFSGIVGTNTNELKVATAIGDDDALADNDIATVAADVVVASTTIAPTSTFKSIITPVAQTAARTLKVFSDNGSQAAGSVMTSTLTGGTPVIVDVFYFLDDVASDLNDVRLPYITES